MFKFAAMRFGPPQTQATFPFLRELAEFFFNGGELPQPPCM